MDRASDSGSEGWGFESLPVYQIKEEIPNGYLLFYFALRAGRDSKGRPSLWLGKKVSSGHFFRPGESP